MVRNLVGTLADVGLGKLDASDFGDILAACDRSFASATAPAKGLVLAWAAYEERYKIPVLPLLLPIV